ncbi:MAG: NUDIX hydrolase [Alkaliphilus sp.]|nr:NUDIX hydrolase [Alkaliphilus sp.]
MMHVKEKTVHSEMIFEGKIINLRVDTVELPNHKLATREIVEHPGAVAVVPVTEDNKIVMVRQYRKPVEDFLLEIPAGKLDKDELPESCARRELEEETGYKAETLKHLLSFYTSPGFSNEILHIYLGQNLTQGKAHPDEDEYISSEGYSLEELMGMIFNGSIMDSKTIIAILATKEYLMRLK